jgi:calcineurin-like phosphoesterase family protein
MSDSHCGHEMLSKNGFRPKGFDRLILDGLKASLKPGDCLIHLGDVAFDREAEEDFMLKTLPMVQIMGRRILVRGNHDSRSISAYLMAGWDFVCDAFELDYYGVHWIFTHEPSPYRVSVSTYQDVYNVHGHLHDNEHRGPRHESGILISLEYMQYRPVELSALARMVASRKQAVTPAWVDGKMVDKFELILKGETQK